MSGEKRLLRGGSLCLVGVLLLPVQPLAHRSRHASVLGWYSLNYFAFLLAYAVLVIVLAVVVTTLCVRRDRVGRWRGRAARLRERRLVFALVLVVPGALLFACVDGLGRFGAHDLAVAGPYASSAALQSIRYGIPAVFESLLHCVRSVVNPRRNGAYRFPIRARIGRQDVDLVFDDLYVSALTARRRDIEASKNLALVHEAFLRLDREVRHAGARLLIVYIPSKEHVYLPLLGDDTLVRQALAGARAVLLGPDGWLSSEGAPWATPAAARLHADDRRDTMRAFCQGHRIEFLDLTPQFQSAAVERAALYYRADTHWNQAGQLHAGRLIAERVAEAEAHPGAVRY